MKINQAIPATAIPKRSGPTLTLATLIGISAILLWYSCAAASETLPATEDSIDFTSLSLDALMNYEITSVSKKPEKYFDATAAIYVVTQEEIRRSSASGIPDLLRMVPGLNVAQINSNQWAVTSRGFNDRFANKLLVLMDGRTIYTPIFSGVYWNICDTMIEDIERIEVIRGPGAALWGANAVNGIINIITKHARDSQGGTASIGSGTHEDGMVNMRYGGSIGETGHYRAYMKYNRRDNYEWRSGRNAHDDWNSLRGGFRYDWDKSGTDRFTLQGDIYDSDAGDKEHVALPVRPYDDLRSVNLDDQGWNILGRWTHTQSARNEIMLQTYYDYSRQDIRYRDMFRYAVRTLDVEFQHRFGLGKRQEVVWGLGFRHISSDINNSSNLSFSPSNRDQRIFSSFIQDEIVIMTDLLKLILGSKFEYNEFTQSEIQPSARLLWTPTTRQSLWIGASRAVSTPSLIQNDMKAFYVTPQPPGALYPGSPQMTVPVKGSHNFDSEELFAYELGYRIQLTKKSSLDIAVFYNDYDRLMTHESADPFLNTALIPPSFHMVTPYLIDNQLRGETYGIELSAQWHPLTWWRLHASYSYLQMQLHDKNSSFVLAEEHEGLSPHNQFSLRSSMDLPFDLELDIFLRYVDSLPGSQVELFSDDANQLLSKQQINSYFEMDLRISWHPLATTEVTFIGRNLLDRQHTEHISYAMGVPETEISRSFYAKITYRF
ncbi:MAG: TonB-dependent receptor [Deltaproteobacteria bacterium]|nr:TonB-dependent receptor [Deltaproteobacteria bacterium]